MENKRVDLAEKIEVIGQIFEIDGMSELLNKFDKGMNQVKFSAVVIQVSGLLLKEKKAVADRLIAMSRNCNDAEVQKLDDGEYATALRDAILTDVMGFFAPSRPSDGTK